MTTHGDFFVGMGLNMFGGFALIRELSVSLRRTQ
jgi:hypothetical protein